jgi:hypothetical protein
MGCLFEESSLQPLCSGESGVTVWVMRVVWASDKGVLPSTPFGLGSLIVGLTFSRFLGKFHPVGVPCGQWGCMDPLFGGPPPTPSFLWRGDHVGHRGCMSCLFVESSLQPLHSGESGVTVWVMRVVWASDKGILPSTPLVWDHQLIH